MKVLDKTAMKNEVCTLDARAHRGAIAAAIAGAVFIVIAAVVGLLTGDGFRRFAFSYLLNFSYFLTLSLGALFFVMIQFVTRASWSVVVRRIAETTAAVMPYIAALAVPVILMSGIIYSWLTPDAGASSELLDHKRAFLNLPFFIIRLVIYFGVWTWLSRTLHRSSVKQDESGDSTITTNLQRFSAPGLVAYALTVTFASFDLLMSLDYEWFSTIFGIYFFTGGAVSFFAFLAIASILLQQKGYLKRVITIEHYHDIGKLIFAFTVFWAYIAFSQFMLIWYGNIPEETSWFMKRQTGSWLYIEVALLIIHFAVPFLWLISRGFKRRRRLLAVGAAIILVAHYLDLYYLIVPEYAPGNASPAVSLIDPLLFIGIGGIFLFALAKTAGRHSLVPTSDPRLSDSLRFENV